MLVNGKHYRTIFEKEGDPSIVKVIDQRLLPHKFKVIELKELDDFLFAIKEMVVRGAPLIGATAGYAMHSIALELKNEKKFITLMNLAAEKVIATRPTAINLKWAVESQLKIINSGVPVENILNSLLLNARKIADEDVDMCKMIGMYGMKLIKKIAKKKKSGVVNILTHCNAGWLATVDYGTALAPIYFSHLNGIKVHIWVDETRPRNQGAKLTAWELGHQGIPHTVIVDNAGGHLMQHNLVDIVIVGSDRTTHTGDVANKIGTYLKALAAFDNNIPFYVALPSSTIDWTLKDGINQIPIEERNPDEVKYIDGLYGRKIANVLVPPPESHVANFAFDVTPAKYVTGLITERGICKADKNSILKLYPEKK